MLETRANVVNTYEKSILERVVGCRKCCLSSGPQKAPYIYFTPRNHAVKSLPL